MPKTCFIVQSFKALFKNEFPDLLSWQYNLIDLIFFHLSSAYIMSIAFDIYIYIYTYTPFNKQICASRFQKSTCSETKNPRGRRLLAACSSGSSNSCKAEGSQGKSPDKPKPDAKKNWCQSSVVPLQKRGYSSSKLRPWRFTHFFLVNSIKIGGFSMVMLIYRSVPSTRST